ncbi:MAG: HEAT repeat domain-containing protein, partial [Aigarchaeota archaeon]|nr:HEAT repeat domain-containing protein [Aigarchaeota archaeon]
MPLFRPNIEKMEKKRDLKGLIRALDHKDSVIKSRAVDALVRIGTPAVGPVIEALRNEGDGVRWELVVTLRRIGDARAVEPLVQALKDEDRRVRHEAVQALGEIGDARALEPLAEALKDAHNTVRMSAADALGTIGDARAVEPLFQSVWDEDERARERAAEALGKMGEKAVAFLVQALKGENREARERAVSALNKIGWQPRDDAERAHYLVTRAPELGKKEWDQLAQIGEPAVEPLIYVLRDEHVSVRRAAVEALGKIGSGRTRGGLSYLFDEPEAEYPVETREQVVEALVKALGDEDIRVCEEAAKALSSIGDLGAAEAILDWLFLFGQSP